MLLFILRTQIIWLNFALLKYFSFCTHGLPISSIYFCIAYLHGSAMEKDLSGLRKKPLPLIAASSSDRDLPRTLPGRAYGHAEVVLHALVLSVLRLETFLLFFPFLTYHTTASLLSLLPLILTYSPPLTRKTWFLHKLFQTRRHVFLQKVLPDSPPLSHFEPRYSEFCYYFPTIAERCAYALS